MTSATLALTEAVPRRWSAPPPAPADAAQRPRKRARAFLCALARQAMPVVLLDADEVLLGCDLARRGYVQAGQGGTAQQPALVVCGLTPWGRRRVASKP